MALYAISDLHLSKAVDKPMDIFGGGWQNYMDKIEENWINLVGEEDWVLLSGDLSWATYLQESVEDFDFLSSLPGKKILIKGNHDYWWTTMNKLKRFVEQEGIDNVYFINNNSYVCESIGVSGTRGWISPESPEFTEHDMKIYKRELNRLELSLKSLKGKSCEEIITMLHYPPLYPGGESRDFLDLMKAYGVKKCIYGHLHGPAFKDVIEGDIEGIEVILTSCDYLNFTPIRLY